MSVSLFAKNLTVETAFDVLAVAQKLKAKGKDIVFLQIGDSPFPATKNAKQAAVDAVHADQSHYCPSRGLTSFRETIAKFYQQEFGVKCTADHVVVSPGAKVLEQFFCEAFMDAGESVLVFSPHFPTYIPNIERRGAIPWYVSLKEEHHFRPDLKEVERFVNVAHKPRAILLNSPHNPTGGVATLEDLNGIADLIRGKNIMVMSDEPYAHMVWEGRHHSFLECPGMMDQAMAVFTFSKSYSMSGYRVGFGITKPEYAELVGKLINTSLSCVPPITQLAAQAALEKDHAERDETMLKFKRKVEILVAALKKVPDVSVDMPVGTFYVFPNVSKICKRLGITSHGLAMFLLEHADEKFGVACLGGECFGPAGQGFLRFSCAEPDDKLEKAVHFLADAVKREERVKEYLKSHAKYQLK